MREPEQNFWSFDEMRTHYAEYVAHIEKNRFTTGFSWLDSRIAGVARGEVFTIIARAGNFKTAFLQNLFFAAIKNQSAPILFFSLELPIEKVFERAIQIEVQQSRAVVERIFKETPGAFPELINEGYKNYYCWPYRVQLEEIPVLMKKFPVLPGLVGIDFLGRINVGGQTEYERISKLAVAVKDIAKYCNVPVVLLSQASRAAEDGTVEITLDMGRGSGAVEEGADFILGMWQDNNELVGRLLKNRNGEPGHYCKFIIQRDTYRVLDINEWIPPVKSSKLF